MEFFKIRFNSFTSSLLLMFLTAWLPFFGWAESNRQITPAEPSCQSHLEGREFLVKPAERKTESYWRSFDREFVKTVSRSITENKHIYLKAIQDKHPHIDFLRQLGFEFKSRNSRNFVKVPTFKELLMQYEKMTQQLVASGQIERANTLIPVRMFFNENTNEVFSIRYGQPIPEGTVPYEELLPDNIFFELLGQGFFPLGEVHQGGLTSTFHTPVEHDLGHLSGLFAHPEYQSQLAVFMRNNHSRLRHSNRNQVFFINEMMQLVRPKNRDRLLKFFERHNLLSPVSQNAGVAVRTESFSKILETLNDVERRKIFDELYAMRFEILNLPGGAIRDVGQLSFAISVHFREVETRNLRDDYVIPFLANPLGRLELLKRLVDHNGNRGVDTRQLAMVLAALENTSHIEFADIFDRAIHFSQSPNDPIYIYFCLNRLTVAEFEMFCMD